MSGSSSHQTEAQTNATQGIISYIAELDKCTMPRPPSKKYYNPKNPTLGIQLLQHMQKSETSSSITIPSPSEVRSDLKSMHNQPYGAFYAEWKAYLGPYPDEPMPPAVPFKKDVEAMMFMTLFPYGMGHYQGPTGHPTPLTFEEYAHHRLVLHDDHFRKNQRWLLWALTRTESKDLAASINLALVLFFKQKSRHIGDGGIETIKIAEDFQPRILENGILVPASARP